MPTRYQIIPPEGEILEKEIDWPKAPNYKNHFRPLLDPIFGHLNWEHVTVLNDSNRRGDMFVEEMGRLKGLALNPRASVIYSRATGGAGIIVGPAVYFPDRRVWF